MEEAGVIVRHPFEPRAASPDGRVRDLALDAGVVFGDERFPPVLRATLADAGVGAERRGRALDALVRMKDEASVPVIQDLLADEELRGPALRALAAFDDEATPSAILERYPVFGRDARSDAIATLTSRPAWASALLEAVVAGTVPSADFAAADLRQLARHAGAEDLERLAEVWAVFRDLNPDRAAEIATWRERLTPAVLAEANLPRGRDLYERTCGQCHTLFGTGGDVGPEITGSNRADLDYLLETVLDPNAVIPAEYQVTEAWLWDERVVAGLLVEENESAVTLRTENERITVARSDIELLRPSEVSMMPEGLLAGLGEDEVRDLVAYLAAPQQVPLLATPDNQHRLFNGTDLAGWMGDLRYWNVEDGAIVGRTEGLARNEFLVSDLWLTDFRLVVEVRLVPDGANSGIQFRSEALPGGDVRGYQADIGVGWWGNLYEEHGRGLLFGLQGERPAKPGEWNVYEILATGSRVRTAIGGVPCTDLDDPEGARGGILALQIHSGGPTEVSFRNFELELNPEPRLRTAE